MSPPRDFSQYGKRRPVRGGVESSNRRGAFGRTWWGRAFVEAIEEHADPGRLTRGKTYARAGQVVAMRIEPGAVTAEVQGSQPRPFTSVLTLRTFDDERLAELVDVVRGAPGMLAETVSGSLPTALGPLLLPRSAAELDFDCTCPDTGWPCKHIAAVAFLTAERLDERPLDMLVLRGVDLDALIAGVEDRAGPDPDDLYGDRTELPALPVAEFRAAWEDLDPVLLRRALRATGEDERAVIAGVRDLQAVYRRLPD
ncbi:SWIM zinc finger family protein [Aldersonia sp. NBC_00410]|uniref:SWIM zinc finger family protein n=1 Tax=Aldersonia sp. NBC_00410 TaxID=2975954 RepID=UPI002255306E|nr:SWIM zinc finger family protein [Aldersonia sp. NBC_00410]MCX5043611.1 SWIM zinc finger family protein [Aldersonia sp. NBC_00410]